MKKVFHVCRHGEQCDALRHFFRIMSARVRMWDNGGETFDRYTIAIKRTDHGVIVWDIYGMSTDATGFNQYSHTHTGKTFTMDAPNKRTRINNVSHELLQAIAARI